MMPETHRELTLPVLHAALAPYRAALQAAAKPAWLLRCREAETVSRYETHVGGTMPFLPVAAGWPVCDKCGEPLDFIWQVDFADFQGAGTFATRGLFQFFYCWDCFAFPQDGGFGYASRWYPDFDAQQMRDEIQLDTPRQVVASPDCIGPLNVDCVPFLSVPGKSDAENPIPHETLNTRVGEKGRRLWSVYSFTEGLYLEKQLISRIGGYPPWIQFEDDTPQCPVCGAYATFVGAIGSDDTGLRWGDSGYWYFFACTATPACRGLSEPLMVLHGY